MPHLIVRLRLRTRRFARLCAELMRLALAVAQPGEWRRLRTRRMLGNGLHACGSATRVTGSEHALRAIGAIGAIAAFFALGACASGTASGGLYDLGPENAPVLSTTLPTLRMYDVHAPRALDSDAIVYRLSYADPRRTAAYANSHWTMTPAQLLTQRLRAALSTHGTVLAGGAELDVPLLTVDLEQFEQVFDSEGQSHGVLTARATLMSGGKVVAQRTFIVSASASLPDAAGGVNALAQASDDFIGQLVTWLATQALASTR